MNSTALPTRQALPARQAPPDIARHLSRVAAWSRLECELRSIIADLLGPNESDQLPRACDEWVTATTDAAVSDVCQAALDRLVRVLDALLVDVPPEVARHLDEARIRHDAGYQ